MWIKICGTTSLEDAQLAIDAGANALGFIFARSPREITPAQAGAIAAQLPAHVERYGVFVHPTFEQVVSTVETAGLTGVQLHATNDLMLAGRLREHFNALCAEQAGRKRLGLLRVLHLPAAGAPTAPGDSLEAQLEQLSADHSVDALLIDSRTAEAEGGTGLRFDWQRASGSFLRAAPHLRLILAGGLDPGNVAEAISTLRPWGVDVVTGVEASPGRKDPRKVRAFMERARATARALGSPAAARA